MTIAGAGATVTGVDGGDLIEAAQLRSERDAGGVREMRGDGGRSRYDEQRWIAEVRRHIAAAAADVLCPREVGEQKVARRLSDRQGYAYVSIIGHHPVVAGAQRICRANLRCLVPLAGDR